MSLKRDIWPFVQPHLLHPRKPRRTPAQPRRITGTLGQTHTCPICASSAYGDWPDRGTAGPLHIQIGGTWPQDYNVKKVLWPAETAATRDMELTLPLDMAFDLPDHDLSREYPI